MSTTTPWPQHCVFGDPGPEDAEADGTWLAKVETCTCTRCELIQLGMDQSKESGKLEGVMSRVRDLEKENAQLKLENHQIKLRLVCLERTSKDLLELATNFKQVYKSKKHHKRKIHKEDADSVEPKKRDPDLEFKGKIEIEEDQLECHQHESRTEGPSSRRPAVPAVPAVVITASQS